jgi:hypothetical protein
MAKRLQQIQLAARETQRLMLQGPPRTQLALLLTLLLRQHLILLRPPKGLLVMRRRRLHRPHVTQSTPANALLGMQLAQRRTLPTVLLGPLAMLLALLKTQLVTSSTAPRKLSSVVLTLLGTRPLRV